MINNLIALLFKIVINTPVYPHWLDFRNRKKGNLFVSKYLKGIVLETGAGNCEKKILNLANNSKIKKYIATDFVSWDNHFEKFNQRKFIPNNQAAEVLFGKKKSANDLDMICDALNLPFSDNTFDSYCSYEVLEHINEPKKYFSEAYRVLKKGGNCVITVPYLYREHGGINFDFQRLSRGGIIHHAKVAGFNNIRIKTFSFFGTTVATLINQFLIRKIYEKNLIIKILLIPLCPFVFFTTNIIGFAIDKVDPDYRFATAYHIVLTK